ncbi:MAG: hypothetical protein ACYC2G_06375 [Gemmatimonadaceae bacterium]
MRPTHIRARVPALLAALAALTAAGCGSDPAGVQPVSHPATLFWSLTADHHAVTLSLEAPHATIELAATPRTHAGQAIAGLAAPTFRALNPAVVNVSAGGLVTARSTGRTSVVASLTASGVTHHDTVAVTVTRMAPGSPPATFEAVAPPVTTVGLYNMVFMSSMTSQLTSTDGTPVMGAAVVYTSLDPTMLKVDRLTGLMDPLRAGHARVAATATAYGVALHDTVEVAVQPAVLQMVETPITRTANGQAARIFSPGSVTVVEGGSVAFLNGTVIDNPAEPMDVTVDDPSGVDEDTLLCFCGAGNIEPFVTAPFQLFTTMRRFPMAGTYTYRSAATGATGRIVVVPAP